MNKPPVDLNNPHQNEFVQDYLAKFNEVYNTAPIDNDHEQVEAVIEQIQEIYTPPNGRDYQ